ncbi:MAG: LysM domain-containing protein, partial [Desulfatitalea sp.]
DIDMVRPGQSIDIPLRKLEHGALPGQDNGVVTIPIVTLSKVMDVLQKNALPYQVERGDTVSQIVARRFGRYGTKAYKEGIQLLQAANPQITDINRIYAGQKIHLPDPSIREKQEYDALYDEKGNLRETIDPNQPATAARPEDGDTGAPSEQQLPPTSVPEIPQSPLAAAVATVGGKLIGKGTYYLPREGATDLEIDLSRHPLLEAGNQRLLFTQDGKIMGQSPETVQSHWPQLKVVAYGPQDSAPEIIAAIFTAMEDQENAPTQAAFEDRGVHVAVRAKWIKPESDQRRLCITPIDTPDQQTPEAMRRYLEQNGIVLKEVLPGGAAVGSAGALGGSRHAVKNVLALTPAGQRDFVQRLAKVLNFSYAPNVPVTFPYAGLQIDAFANLVTTPDGREVLLDFAELYGGAVKAIQESGLNVVQIGTEESYTTITGKLLAGLSEPYIENPSFQAAARPAEYNVTVTIAGLLYADAQNKRTLLSDSVLHPAITDLLSAEGIAVVTW